MIADRQVAFSDRDNWAYKSLFLDGWCLGCPPDYFSKDGQAWGFSVVDPDKMFNDDGSLGKPANFYTDRAIREVAFPKAYAYDDYDTRSKIREKNPVEESFLKAIQEFAWQTSAVFLENKKENVNYSPLSLYYALSLCGIWRGGKDSRRIALSSWCGQSGTVVRSM